jgi:hypothetical protein
MKRIINPYEGMGREEFHFLPYEVEEQHSSIRKADL